MTTESQPATPAARVQEFLDQRATMRGLDAEEIHSANLAALTVSDLQALVDAVSATTALAATWKSEAEQRGPGDTLITDGAAEMLLLALRGTAPATSTSATTERCDA